MAVKDSKYYREYQQEMDEQHEREAVQERLMAKVNYKMSAAVWKQYALRLARAIIRFEKDEWQHVHTDSTLAFAFKVVKEGKRGANK
jgi:hypothetical protein